MFREAHTLKGAAAVVGLGRRPAGSPTPWRRSSRGSAGAIPWPPRRRSTPCSAPSTACCEMVPAVLAGDDRAGHADRLVAALHDPPRAADPEPDPGPPASPAPPPDPEPASVVRAAVAQARPPPGGNGGETVRLRCGTARRAGPAGGEASVGRPAGRAGGHRPARGRAGGRPRAARPEPHPERPPGADHAGPHGPRRHHRRAAARAVRDLARALGKEVELGGAGEETELDRGVLQQLADALLHIVRNAVDHGIETPEERLAAGKPAQATVRLHAAQLGSEVVIAVTDDGRGIDVGPGPRAGRQGRRRRRRARRRRGVYAHLPVRAVDRATQVSEVSGTRRRARRRPGQPGRGPGPGRDRSPSRARAPSSASSSRSPWPSCRACWSRRPADVSRVPMHSVRERRGGRLAEDHGEGRSSSGSRTILPVSDLAPPSALAGGDDGERARSWW